MQTALEKIKEALTKQQQWLKDNAMNAGVRDTEFLAAKVKADTLLWAAMVIQESK